MFLSTIVLSVFLAVTVSIVSGNEISGFWSERDLKNIADRCQSILSSKSPREVYFAAKTLQALSKSSDKKICAETKTLSESAHSESDWYFVQKLSTQFNCGVSVPNSAFEFVDSKLQSNNANELIDALRLGHSAGRLSSEQLAVGIAKTKNLLIQKDESFSTQDAHAALDLLTELKDESSASDAIASFTELAVKLLPNGQGNHLADPTLLSSMSQLSSKKIKIPLLPTAEALLPLKYAEEAETLYKAYDSLDRITAYKAAPLFVRHQSDLLKHGETVQNIAVEVVTLVGQSVAVKDVEIVSIKPIGKDTLLSEGVRTEGSVVNIAESALDSGRYIINLSVAVETKSSPLKYQGTFSILHAAKVQDVRAAVTNSKSADSLTPVSSQNSLTGLTGSAVGHQYVHVEYAVSSSGNSEPNKRMQQSFLRFTHKTTGKSTIFAAKKSSSQSVDYRVSVSLADESANFNYMSGTYIVSIVVGDAILLEPLEWVMGSIELVFPSKTVTNLPLYARSLLHTSDTTLNALPEIEHQMRPPAKRASNFMSTLFTGLSIVPLLGFIGFTLSLKLNLVYLRSLTSILFVVCFVGTLLLYSGYWLAVEGLSFYKTIKYLLISLPITLFVGHHALQSVIHIREAATATKKD